MLAKHMKKMMMMKRKNRKKFSQSRIVKVNLQLYITIYNKIHFII